MATDRALARMSQLIADACAGAGDSFASTAAQKRALDLVNRAYRIAHQLQHDAAIAAARPLADAGDPAAWNAYWSALRASDTPFELHQVRDRHLPLFDAVAIGDGVTLGAIVRQLVALRGEIKSAPIAAAVAVTKPEAELAARVERSLGALIDLRRAQYASGLRLLDVFGRLPVTVSVHVVRGHKGAVFLRRFYYLDGKLTPLGVICALLEEEDRRAR